MFIPISFFIFGLALIIKGADFLVAGASSLAKKMNISELAIGLTIVAFGTSLPELTVNIFASIQGSTELAIGNILGSNIANILLILGIAALIYPLKVTKGTVWKEIPLSLLAAIAVGLMANDIIIDGALTSKLSRIDGLILLSFFIIFMYYIFGIAKSDPKSNEANPPKYSVSKSSGLVALGLIALIVGGKLVVDNAIQLATMLNISTSLIGLTVVAVGTSLPELATSAVASYRRNTDIAIGNAVGSNIFNIFWILGISAVVKPLPFQPQSNFDISMVIFASLLLFIFMFVGRRHFLERWQGGLFILTYIAYIALLTIGS